MDAPFCVLKESLLNKSLEVLFFEPNYQIITIHRITFMLLLFPQSGTCILICKLLIDVEVIKITEIRTDPFFRLVA